MTQFLNKPLPSITLFVMVIMLIPGFMVADPSKIDWISNWEESTNKAKETNKIRMVDFFTDWCGWCHRLDETTFIDTNVVKIASNFICVKINAESKEGTPLASKYGVNGFPCIMFIAPDGMAVGKISGYLPPEPFASEMSKIMSQGELPTLEDGKKLVEASIKDPKKLEELHEFIANMSDTGNGLAALELLTPLLNLKDTKIQYPARLMKAKFLMTTGPEIQIMESLLEPLTTSKEETDMIAEAMILLSEFYLFVESNAEKANKQLEAIEKKKSFQAKWLDKARVYKGITFLLNEEVDKAISHMEAYIKDHPKSTQIPLAYTILILVYQYQGLIAETVELLNTFKKNNPEIFNAPYAFEYLSDSIIFPDILKEMEAALQEQQNPEEVPDETVEAPEEE